jgi:hypothetical protein
MEWGKSLFIIIVFVVLTFQVLMSVGIKTVQENWPEYRCNPMYMPFASTLAPTKTTAGENFSYCIQDFAMSAAPSFTQPLSYVQSMTLALMGDMTTSQEKNTEQTAKFSFSVNQMFSSLFSVIAGIVAQFQILIGKLTDAQGKMMGSMTALLYIVTATQYAFVSMWNGIPGALIRGFSSLKV